MGIRVTLAENTMSGILSIVSTPIGNLEDMTLRGVRVLKESNAIACEDTRVTKKLLTHYGIHPEELVSLHQHSGVSAIDKLIHAIQSGKRVAYVSDAGTPNVNDPGGKLVEAAYEADLPIEIIPGASALTAAIAACGFPMEHFVYAGFIPQKKHRAMILKEIAERKEATVFFESTHRILKTLTELNNLIDEDRICYAGRELTKKFETHLRGTLSEILKTLQERSSKGEFVVIIGPKR